MAHADDPSSFIRTLLSNIPSHLLSMIGPDFAQALEILICLSLNFPLENSVENQVKNSDLEKLRLSWHVIQSNDVLDGVQPESPFVALVNRFKANQASL
jgi:hypothetical protein